MGPENRREDSPVIRELVNQGRMYSFYQVVHLLQSIGGRAADVGELGPAAEERVRFQSNASLGFPASDVENIETLAGSSEGDVHFLVTVNQLGLYGPASPMPSHYTEEVLSEDPEESTLRAFLDLFDHRLVSFLYRCWRKYRYYIQYEPGASDSFSQWLFAFVGLLHPSTREEEDVEWVRLICYTGLLGMRARSAFTLRSIIYYYFVGVPARIEQAVPDWVWIEEPQWNQLGWANSTPGQDCILGSRIRDLTGKFRVHLGPLDWETFVTFLPDGHNHSVLKRLVSLVVSDRLNYDIALHLSPSDVPPFELSSKSLCRLGWSTWFGQPRPGEAIVRLKGR